MENSTERCCPKRRRYKPDFYVKECKKVWPADEEIKHELRLYDEAHSKDKCISKEYFNHLERDLFIYAEGKKERSCESARELLWSCLHEATCISHCTEKINNFLKCVNLTIKEEYAPKSE